MNRLNIPRFGFGFAAASAIVYLGCVFVMLTVQKQTAIRFFNSLMHGVDVTPLMRWDMPFWETASGTVEIFILGWLFGAIIAGCYNAFEKSDKKQTAGKP